MLFNIFIKQTLADDFWGLHKNMNCAFPLKYSKIYEFISNIVVQAYVSCSLGIEKIGFAMICYGATSGISSLALGVVVKWLNNAFLVAFGFFLHSALMVWLLLWDKSHRLVTVFYIAGGLLGVCNAVWSAVTNGKYFVLLSTKLYW